mmetsp:Transcript_76009/g.199349  ORF Transcript_76009/g.199349 Transcript_76009/m.199349 type:complete len:394 (+) Transcript_76009:53-1234(+)
MHLIIKSVQPPVGGAAEFPLDIDVSATVEELKEQIAGRVGLPKNHIRLVCAGRIWADAATVGSFEPHDGSIVHCLNNAPRGAPAAAAQQSLTPADPMAQMMGGGMMAPPAAGGDPMQQMMAQSQQMMQQNPDMMQQIMRSPMVQQMMSNPETMRAMMRMNPQLNQLMETRPEIARMLEDPEVLRQSMQMMANPSLMREMTRNADRSIGNLDAMPGGHNALVRAHQEFADPLYEALSGSQGAAIAANAEAYAQQTQGAPNNDALPNPWGAPAPPAAAPAPAAAAPAAAAANPFAAMMGAAAPAPGAAAAANPMAAMMQQMMGNPAPLGGAVGGGAPPTSPTMLSAQRTRFAEQLTQLMAMGFTNEDVCLRILVQHNGRVDTAIDALLASGEGSS